MRSLPAVVRIRSASGVVAMAAAVLALSACDTAASTEDAAGGRSTSEITVFAAASLQAAFEELADRFEREHPGIDVRPVVADGSATLVTQLLEGADADVLATADEHTMSRIVNADLAVADPVIIATNTLVIATPAGNPAAIDDLGDLREGTVVVCAPAVPCGAAASALLDRAGIRLSPVSLEHSVTSVLTKVATGQVDAGLVYASEVVDRTDVDVIVPEAADEVVNRYPIVALARSGAPAAATAFAEFVAGPAGVDVLTEFGFGAP